MVRKVIYTKRSRKDLKTICDYVAADNPSAALKLGLDLMDYMERLCRFPKMGRFHRSRDVGEIFELSHRGYRIFYLVPEAGETVEIWHIRHGAREEPEL